MEDGIGKVSYIGGVLCLLCTTNHSTRFEFFYPYGGMVLEINAHQYFLENSLLHISTPPIHPPHAGPLPTTHALRAALHPTPRAAPPGFFLTIPHLSAYGWIGFSLVVQLVGEGAPVEGFRIAAFQDGIIPPRCEVMRMLK